MSKYGEVVDVYIPHKQNRSGMRFGFVRFRGIRDIQRLLSDVNRVQVEKGTVKANTARQRNQMGPWKVHVEGLMRFTREPPDWIPLWFKSFTPWRQGDRATCRRCWVTIRGMPLNAWCMEFFQMVGDELGQFLRVDEDTEQRARREDFIDGDSVPPNEVPEFDDRTLDGEGEEDRQGDENERNHSPDFQAESQDPFRIMEILHDNPRDNTVNHTRADLRKLTRVDCIDVGTGSGLGLQCCDCNQLVENVNKGLVISPNPVRLSNSFGPLADTKEGESVNGDEELGGQVQCDSPSTAASSKTKGSGSSRRSSHTSPSSNYLVKRLDAAVKAARVNQRCKTQKIRDTGSLTSSHPSPNGAVLSVNDSITQAQPNGAVGSVNESITQTQPLLSSTTPTPPDFEHLEEALLTIQVRDTLAWDASADTNKMVALAQDLVEKEKTTSEPWVRRLWLPLNLDFVVVDSVGASGGLLCMWDGDFFNCTRRAQGTRWIAVEVFLVQAKVTVTIVCVYAPVDLTERLNLWGELVTLKQSFGSPWLVVGDLNEILVSWERKTGRVCARGVAALRQFMNTLQLLEFPLEGRLFTWANSLTVNRLDRAMAQAEWSVLFLKLFLSTGKRGNSDHWSLILK
ncbi:hypothetical protein Tsubulata_011275 [Turnera subulata]|uniref:RRM domain-containing protein n=1 Tax=Turnera subulata TaxID=218843 RepID=A0A9Q0G4K7_9ROSI|nr:hypothetical protein Tsubulata_011275 [Turnera subulata]